MKKHFIPIFSVLVLGLFLTVTAFNSKKISTPKELEFSLKDYNGKTHNLADYKKNKAIVIMFIATECPVSNAYNERMASIYNNFKDKNVAFLGINSNKAEDVAAIKAHSQKNKFGFPVLKDDKNKVADNYGAQVTPEVYVLSPDYKLLYHGRIDDSRNEDDVESKDLENALNSILDGKEVKNKETKAFGCTIKRI